MNDLKGIIEDCNKSDLISDKVIKKIIEIIGQEEWQELHDENNDVCTTMGELIITLKGIAELEKENAELKEVHESDKRSLALIAKKGADFERAYNEAEELLDKQIEATYKVVEENKELKELVEKYRQAVDKCLHITFMGGGCEVNTIGQYATLVDGYLTDVEGLAKWKN